MGFINDHQLPLILLCFLSGCAITAFLFRRHVSQRAWKVADLVWICLGGIGALTAVVAGVYAEDSSRLSRQIDIAYSAARTFDRDAARFRLAHCEVDHPAAAFRPAIHDLCDKVEFLSASTAGNSELPLFLAVTERAAPLQGLNLFFGEETEVMDVEIQRFDEAEFLAFEASDDRTDAAANLLRQAPSVAGIAAEFRVLAQSYEDLIDEVMHLRDEWDVLQAGSSILTLQILALCLVAFAAPFRLGKSIVELM